VIVTRFQLICSAAQAAHSICMAKKRNPHSRAIKP
jgi:hypothetical protein